MEDRILQLEQLIQSLQKPQNLDLGKVIRGLNEIAKSLQNACKNEIDLNKKGRDMENLLQENSILKLGLEKMKHQTNYYRAGNEDQLKKLLTYQQEYSRCQRDLVQERKVNDEQRQKILSLESRIEMLLEKNFNTHQDQLRKTLNDLLKENERLKRQKLSSNNEIDRLKELNQKLLSKNLRLIKKLNSMKTKKFIDDDEAPSETKLISLDTQQMPINLDFRNLGLDSEQINILQDLLEHGVESFLNQWNNLEDLTQKKELMKLVTQQYLSYKDFGDRNNQMLIELCDIGKLSNLEDYQWQVSRQVKEILDCEQVYLWVIDQMTGTVKSVDQQKRTQKGLLLDGEFSVCVNSSQIVQSNGEGKERLLYRNDMDEQVVSKSYVLMPIMLNGNVFGILDIRGSKSEFNLDTQYYGVIFCCLGGQFLQKVLNQESLLKQLRYEDLFQKCFLDMCNTKNKCEFYWAVQNSAKKVFSISQTVFLFVEGGKFMKFNEKGEKQFYQLNTGIAGEIMSNGRPLIVNGMSRSPSYDQSVDISTILPVFCTPIKRDGHIEAVFELVIKSKIVQSRHPFGNHSNLQMKQDSADQDINRFCEYVQSAYNVILVKKIE